ANSIIGNDSNNILRGGAGNDTLLGFQGVDQFVFAEAPGTANADLIGDFTSGQDKLVLDGRTYIALGGSFGANDPRFYSAPGAVSGHDTDDRLIYDSAAGKLYYDADGSGAQAAQIVATLERFDAPAALQASDVTIITPTP